MDEPSANRQATPTLPGALDWRRDSALAGRASHTWTRRAVLTLMALVVLASLLNLFGQQPSADVARGGGARLTLEAPTSLRGGLIFQTRIEIAAEDAAIAAPTLILDDGWLDSITLNALTPEPESQSGEGDRAAWRFGPIPAGDSITVWAEWQVNPSRVGSADGRLTLRDGDRPLTAIDRTIRFFP